MDAAIDPNQLAEQILTALNGKNYILLIALLLVGCVKTARWFAKRSDTKLGRWLGTDRGGVALNFTMATVGGLVTALKAGAPLDLSLFIKILTIAVGAAGVFNLGKKTVTPGDKAPPASSDVTAQPPAAPSDPSPPAPPTAAMFIPLALASTIALAMLAACGPNAKDKAVLNAATTVAAGYRTLGRVDVQRQNSIRLQANVDAEGAKLALKRHLALYVVLEKALDGAVAVIEQINKQGLTAALLGTLGTSITDVTNAGMAYEKGGAQ